MAADEAKEAIVKMTSGLVALKAYESKLAAILQKIRVESLEKLQWYENQFGKLLTIVLHHESRSDLLPDPTKAFYELLDELKKALAESPDDDSRHDMPGGDVGNPE